MMIYESMILIHKFKIMSKISTQLNLQAIANPSNYTSLNYVRDYH